MTKVTNHSHTNRNRYKVGSTLVRRQVKASFAGILGTVLQWYDFSLFGYLSVIIAKTFFPQSNHFAALLSTFGLFAVGFLLAPLGALFFGHIGDRYGRKFTLTISVLLMCIPTTCIALLPGYNHIGIFAPLILTLLRLIQGFVASAEFAGSAIFLVEHGSAGKKSFFGSLTSLSYTIGLILGSFVCTIFTHSSLPAWYWRIPY